MITENSIYHLGDYSPLVEVIDRQNGYILLKNLCNHSGDRCYSIAAERDDSKSPYMPNPINETWITHSRADEIMRTLLNNPIYNKATRDFMHNYEA